MVHDAIAYAPYELQFFNQAYFEKIRCLRAYLDLEVYALENLMGCEGL